MDATTKGPGECCPRAPSGSTNPDATPPGATFSEDEIPLTEPEGGDEFTVPECGPGDGVACACGDREGHPPREPEPERPPVDQAELDQAKANMESFVQSADPTPPGAEASTTSPAAGAAEAECAHNHVCEDHDGECVDTCPCPPTCGCHPCPGPEVGAETGGPAPDGCACGHGRDSHAKPPGSTGCESCACVRYRYGFAAKELNTGEDDATYRARLRREYVLALDMTKVTKQRTAKGYAQCQLCRKGIMGPTKNDKGKITTPGEEWVGPRPKKAGKTISMNHRAHLACGDGALAEIKDAAQAAINEKIASAT